MPKEKDKDKAKATDPDKMGRLAADSSPPTGWRSGATPGWG